MDDARAMVRVIERIAQLAGPRAQLERLENLLPLVAAHTRKSVPIDVFHGDAARAFVIHEVVDPHDVRVGEFQTAPRLAL